MLVCAQVHNSLLHKQDPHTGKQGSQEEPHGVPLVLCAIQGSSPGLAKDNLKGPMVMLPTCSACSDDASLKGPGGSSLSSASEWDSNEEPA